jgi:sugar O-acyltransferase (sialic acid O-acetyltransferase NeuD family)
VTAPEVQNPMITDKIAIGLFGAGGYAREVMPIVLEYIDQQSSNSHLYEIYFVEHEPKLSSVNGFKVISESKFFDLDCDQKFFNIAIGDSRIREKISNICLSNNSVPLSLIASNVSIYNNNQIGDGAIISAHSTITSNARIGKFFHSNIYSYVAHDCEIGDYVTFAPNVHCNGNVHIHNHAYIGTGAILRQGANDAPLIIGEGAVVGMGAVVTKNVAPFSTVIGNPARPYEKA